mgnify:CR=1 FL=1
MRSSNKSLMDLAGKMHLILGIRWRAETSLMIKNLMIMIKSQAIPIAPTFRKDQTNLKAATNISAIKARDPIDTENGKVTSDQNQKQKLI